MVAGPHGPDGENSLLGGDIISDSACGAIWGDPNAGSFFSSQEVYNTCLKVLKTLEEGLIVNYHYSATAAIS